MWVHIYHIVSKHVTKNWQETHQCVQFAFQYQDVMMNLGCGASKKYVCTWTLFSTYQTFVRVFWYDVTCNSTGKTLQTIRYWASFSHSANVLSILWGSWDKLTATRIQKKVTDKYGPGCKASMLRAMIPPNTAEIPTMTSITCWRQ